MRQKRRHLHTFTTRKIFLKSTISNFGYILLFSAETTQCFVSKVRLCPKRIPFGIARHEYVASRRELELSVIDGY
jgi:hypothetical protein